MFRMLLKKYVMQLRSLLANTKSRFSFDCQKGAVIGIDDEDDSTFTITVDQKTFHFQGKLLCCIGRELFWA